MAWSASQLGRIVSCGGDGKIVVYEEVDIPSADSEGEKTHEWKIVAEVQNAHGVYEVNGVCWAKRWDKGKRFEGEELIVTTGDDGVVSFWEMSQE